MDKKKLKQYLPNKARLKRLDKRIEELCDRDVETVMGKVTGSSPDFPYTETRTSVLMDDPYEADKIHRQIREKEAERLKILKEAGEVEEFIAGISDVEIKELFELLYQEGKKQREVAEIVNLDRSRISRKVSDFLKNAHKAQK